MSGTAVPAADRRAGRCAHSADLTVIEAEVFCGDTTIDCTVVPEGTLSVGRRAFEDSSLSEITLPESLTVVNAINAVKYLFIE